MTWLWIFIGGGLGSVARFGLSRCLKLWDVSLPIATLLANVIACIVLSWIWTMTDMKESRYWFYPLLAIGFCGGLSTFSTFSLETVQLMRQGQWLWVILNVVITTGLCLLIVYRMTRNVVF